jgi:hypothetical protein
MVNYEEYVELYYLLLADMKALKFNHIDAHQKSKALRTMYFNILKESPKHPESKF